MLGNDNLSTLDVKKIGYHMIKIVIKNKTLKYFLIFELILYITFAFLDIFQLSFEISSILKYISIWSCLVFVFLSYLKSKEKSILYMSIILIFTLISDFLLLFTRSYEMGIIFFMIVQVLYSFKIKLICQDSCKFYMVEVLAVTFFWNLIVLLMKHFNLLSPIIVVASWYFVIFTANMIRIWLKVFQSNKANKKVISFAIGLTLFYLCDINVGLNYLLYIENLPRLIVMFANNAGIFIWLFYLPSQIILSVHGVFYSKEELIPYRN